jgi:hypothetical protein
MLIDAMAEDRRPKDGSEMIEHTQQPPSAVPKALAAQVSKCLQKQKMSLFQLNLREIQHHWSWFEKHAVLVQVAVNAMMCSFSSAIIIPGFGQIVGLI